MPKAERRYVVPLLASRRGEKDDTRYRKTFAPAHYSQFVFRNNTVCSGKRHGFPVIYRQSDEARQTEPPIISFPLISPLSWAIVQPAAGSLSRLQIGWQKRNGNQPFRFSDCQKSLAEFAPAGANKVPSIFAGGMYVGKNTSRLANVRAKASARRRAAAFSNESPAKRVSLESVSKILF